MNLTINEIKERLAQFDELSIIELLDINSYELVEFLEDQIEFKYDYLIEALSDEEDAD